MVTQEQAYCTKCYRRKELAPALQETPEILVCARCRMDLEETLGFLILHGVEVTLSHLPTEQQKEADLTSEAKSA